MRQEGERATERMAWCNVEMMLHFLARDYPRNSVDTPAIVARLRSIHEPLAQRIARNDAGEDIIDAL